MNIIKQSSISIPRNAWELTESIGADQYEGVQVAIFPSEPSEAALGAEFAYAPGVIGTPVFATFEAWGPRLLDVLLNDTARGVRWWKVKEYARAHKVDYVPVNWQGPIAEIPDKFFANPLTGIRFWSAGPWFWPIKQSYMEDNLKVLERFC